MLGDIWALDIIELIENVLFIVPEFIYYLCFHALFVIKSF